MKKADEPNVNRNKKREMRVTSPFWSGFKSHPLHPYKLKVGILII